MTAEKYRRRLKPVTTDIQCRQRGKCIEVVRREIDDLIWRQVETYKTRQLSEILRQKSDYVRGQIERLEMTQCRQFVGERFDLVVRSIELFQFSESAKPEFTTALRTDADAQQT